MKAISDKSITDYGILLSIYFLKDNFTKYIFIHLNHANAIIKFDFTEVPSRMSNVVNEINTSYPNGSDDVIILKFVLLFDALSFVLVNFNDISVMRTTELLHFLLINEREGKTIGLLSCFFMLSLHHFLIKSEMRNYFDLNR